MKYKIYNCYIFKKILKNQVLYWNVYFLILRKINVNKFNDNNIKVQIYLYDLNDFI